jgi:hypothetical protein
MAVPADRALPSRWSVRDNSVVPAPGEEAAAADRAVSTLAAWQMQEGPLRAPPRVRPPAFPPTITAVERLLLGSGPQGAEIRLRIGHGPLAGAEIHLRQLPGGVEAVVLTRVESSRQTLAVAMEEVARRLHRKGYAFRAQARDPLETTAGPPRPAAGTDHTGGAHVSLAGQQGKTGSVER